MLAKGYKILKLKRTLKSNTLEKWGQVTSITTQVHVLCKSAGVCHGEKKKTPPPPALRHTTPNGLSVRRAQPTTTTTTTDFQSQPSVLSPISSPHQSRPSTCPPHPSRGTPPRCLPSSYPFFSFAQTHYFPFLMFISPNLNLKIEFWN